MTNVPFVTSDWRRDSAQEPVLKFKNRYFEVNPTNFEKGSAVILRPGFRRFTLLDTSSVKSMYASQGLFHDFIFALTADGNIKVAPGGTSEQGLAIASAVPHNNQGTFTDQVGSITEYFFSINEYSVYVTAPLTFSHNVLTGTGTSPAENNAVVQIGDMYYKFTTGSVDTGSPDGSSGNPWLVDNGLTLAGSILNLYTAIGNFAPAIGQAGITYSTALIRNPLVNPFSFTSSTLTLVSSSTGGTGSEIAVSVSATTILSWATPTFSGGGDTTPAQYLTQLVYFPFPLVHFIAITTFNAYVIMVTKSNEGHSGRFYWLQPGSTQLDLLDFATAEMAPDTLESVRAITDFLWLFGAETIEVWYATGDPDTPFARNKGQAFNFGIFAGTDQLIENDILFISKDYKVRQVSGTSAQIISNPSIESQIRTFVETSTEAVVNTIRTWWSNFDGHFAYFINLGDTKTLVYDLTTQQWMEWGTQDQDYLVPTAGIPALTAIAGYPAERYLPIAADLTSGQLWWFDPDYRFDDVPGDTEDVTLIPATVTAGVPMVGRNTARNNQIYLAGSVGNPSAVVYYLIDGDGGPILIDGASGPYLIESDTPFTNYDFLPSAIQLEISDDQGHTWWNAGEVEVTVDTFNQEIAWRSLGIVSAPGRLFRFNDYGAMIRFDRMDIF